MDKFTFFPSNDIYRNKNIEPSTEVKIFVVVAFVFLLSLVFFRYI